MDRVVAVTGPHPDRRAGGPPRGGEPAVDHGLAGATLFGVARVLPHAKGSGRRSIPAEPFTPVFAEETHIFTVNSRSIHLLMVVLGC
ncbi:MAG TPA: hypothetical protein VMK12_22575 [Anaeromyxobacteraceae bacterium]|nr:hypothetical protein [Anaeromyxobacteraceae bacterium]